MLSDDQKGKLCKLLPSPMKCNIKMAAVWADKIKKQKKWAFTDRLHYANAPDSPPSNCLIDYSIFFQQKNNLMSSIWEFMEQLGSKTSSDSEKQYALLFLLHLVGDMHNPLHCNYNLC